MKLQTFNHRLQLLLTEGYNCIIPLIFFIHLPALHRYLPTHVSVNFLICPSKIYAYIIIVIYGTVPMNSQICYESADLQIFKLRLSVFKRLIYF